MNRFPLFIDMTEKKVVVVGGGKVAQRRIKKLLAFSACITLISPHITEELKSLSKNKEIKLIKREYTEGDLEGAFLAIAATNRRSVNRTVFEDANKLRIFANIADCKEESAVWFPQIIENSEIIMGVISKSGNPKLVKLISEKIKKGLDNET